MNIHKSKREVVMLVLAHRGGKDPAGRSNVSCDNAKSEILACLEQADGAHLPIQYFAGGIGEFSWCVYHGRIPLKEGSPRLLWNVSLGDIDPSVRSTLLFLQEALVVAHEKEKQLFLELKVPASFRGTEALRKHALPLFAELCGDWSAVAAVLTADRLLFKDLLVFNEEREKIKLCPMPLGVIVDEKKLREMDSNFPTEGNCNEERNEEVVAFRVGMVIEAMVASREEELNAVFLNRETAFVGPRVLEAARRRASFTAVLTVDDVEEAQKLQGYGSHAPDGIVTNYPSPIRRGLAGYYDARALQERKGGQNQDDE